MQQKGGEEPGNEAKY